MISAMLLEIPNMAANQFAMHKRVISKSFKKLMDQYDQRAFHLAAESYRDNIVFAARELNKSNWKKALENIFGISHISRLSEFQDGKLKAILTQRFKEVAL